MGSNSSGLQRVHKVVIFDEFFELGLAESSSPFLTPASRPWAVNIPLKVSLLSAGLLTTSFGLFFVPEMIPLSYLLLVLVYFFAGVPSLIESIEDLANLQINIDVLMTLAAFSSVLIGSGFEGGLLLVLFALSGSIEDAVTAKAKGSISGLKKLSPSKAIVLKEDGTTIDRAVADIAVGTTILVKAGEVVPLDGKVTKGASTVNLVHLTGESIPVPKNIGDAVAAGALNLDGVLTVKVTHTSADSTVARIVNLVTQAQEARPQLQRWFDKVSERYAVSIILLALFFTMSMPFALGIDVLGVEGSLYRSLAFLIAASPCALILAIPIAYLSAVSVCAKQGILLKGGITLDALASCHAIAFDKTGTLTTGNLTCLGIEALNSGDINQAISVAAAMEKNAVHPIAKAIVSFSQERNIPSAELQDFKSVPGYGLEATFNGQKTAIGRLAFIKERLSEEALKDSLQRRMDELRESGELLTIMLLGQSVFLLRFSDTVRPQMRETILGLRKSQHWRLLMLTGDHVTSARKIAQELGIEEYYADLLPEHKLQYVSTLASACGLAMVGDGINDAPALARATVGICMGKVGSSTAIDASDVVLLHDDLSLLDWLMSKARHTQVIVKQNLGVATGAIIVASLSALAGIIPLWVAVVMHEGGTVLVGLNALRLLRK